jgi:F0F1-type ATP synthase delta subunit
MKIKPKQYAIALYETLDGLSREKKDVIIGDFIKFLAKNNVLRFAPRIIDYFEKYANRKEGVAKLKIKTAQKLKVETITAVENALPNLLKRKIEKVDVTEEIVSNLIGGFFLECDDFIFDSTIKNKLKILKNNLK